MNIIHLQNRLEKVSDKNKNLPTRQQINARLSALGFDPETEWAWTAEHERTTEEILAYCAERMNVPEQIIYQFQRMQ